MTFAEEMAQAHADYASKVLPGFDEAIEKARRDLKNSMEGLGQSCGRPQLRAAESD